VKHRKKALNLLKKIKNEISSDDVFKQGFMYNLNLLLEGNAIFVKFWTLTYNILNVIPYSVSLLPGLNKGVSGSTIAGYNIGIVKDIAPEKKNAAITTLIYMTSKEFQKKYFLIENVDAGISSLYEDEEICKKINCEVFKNVQLNGRPSSEYYSFGDYTNRITKYVNQFLYENQPIEKVLNEIIDLTEIHYVSISNNDTKLIVVIFLIIVMIVGILLFIPLSLIFVKKCKLFFIYFSKELWIIITLGLIIILSSFFTTLGQLTKLKCNIYIIQLIVGYTFILVPILYKYIIDFPQANKMLKWIPENKYIFFLVFLLIDIALILIISINNISVDIVLINEGKNFNKCIYNSIIGLILSLICYITVLVAILLLSYIEWYHKTYCYDVRINAFIIYTNTLVVFLSFIFQFISINDYTIYFFRRNVLILISVVSSILLLYIYRLYVFFFTKNKYHTNPTETSNISDSTNSYNYKLIMKLKRFQNMSNDIGSSIRSDESQKSSDNNNGFIMKLKKYQNMSRNMEPSITDNESKNTSI